MSTLAFCQLGFGVLEALRVMQHQSAQTGATTQHHAAYSAASRRRARKRDTRYIERRFSFVVDRRQLDARFTHEWANQRNH